MEKGKIGRNISWTLEQNGDLHIEGIGILKCTTLYGESQDNVVVYSHLKSIRERVVRIFIDEGIESIGEFSFYEFPQLTEVYMPYTVKIIKAGAFKNCSKLRHIELPSQLERIGIYAFENCVSLENFRLPDNISIGTAAFRNCSSLSELYKQRGSIVVFQNAFENCKSLNHVVLNGVGLVGTYAFKGCPVNYLSLSFKRRKGNTVPKLQSEAFAGSGLKEIHLNFNVSKVKALFCEIEDNCFKHCWDLKDVFFESAIPHISEKSFSDKEDVCIHVRKSKYNQWIVKKALKNRFEIQAH